MKQINLTSVKENRKQQQKHTTMKNTATTQQADTRKSSSLLKKHLTDMFGVKFSIKTRKFSMGSSLDISWVCGPDTSEVEEIVNCLQYGYFNGMEDIYEHVEKEPLVIDGYIIQQQKYVSCERSIPENLSFEMTKALSNEVNYTDAPKLETIDQLHVNFKEMIGSAWNWSQLAYQMNGRNGVIKFHTDDAENIKIIKAEYSWEEQTVNYTYEYKGQLFNTNNNLKTEKMEAKKFKIGQTVKVTFKNGTNYEGEVTKVTEKSLAVDSEGKKKMVILSTATVDILSEPKQATEKPEAKAEETKTKAKGKTTSKAKKATEEAKNNDDKKEVSTFAEFLEFIKADFPVSNEDMEEAKAIILSEEGLKKLQVVCDKYLAGDYPKAKLNDLATELSSIGKNYNTAKEETAKAEPELHPMLKALSEVTDEASFKAVKDEITKAKAVVYSKKKKFEVTLTDFINGNIYVQDEKTDKKYFSLPSRFAVHFDIK